MSDCLGCVEAVLCDSKLLFCVLGCLIADSEALVSVDTVQGKATVLYQGEHIAASVDRHQLALR